jgi:FlaA1/EpsC-like NDP-sugar epimerase
MNLLSRLQVLPRWTIAILDSLVLFACALFGYLVRFNFELELIQQYDAFAGSLTFMIGGFLVMQWTRSFEGIVRHTGLKDASNIFRTVLINFTLFLLINFFQGNLLDKTYLLPTSVLIIASLSAMFVLMFYRLMVKELYVYRRSNFDGKILRNGVIFGAGELGVIVQDAIKNDTKNQMHIAAFLDDDVKKEGKNLGGKRIYRGLHELEKLVNLYGITELIIGVKDLSVTRKNEIIDECLRLKVSVSMVPPVDQWIDSGLTAGVIREIKIEDLLSREQIVLDNPRIEEDLKGKVVLVTGAAGSIGAELCRQISHYHPKLIVMLDLAESPLYDIEQLFKEQYPTCPIKIVLGDVRNKKKMIEVFRDFSPEVVFHAAAYKHVPMIENYPEEAIHSNVIGTKTLADLSVQSRVEKFVLVSTDKAVNPTNVMGATKRAAEMYVHALNHYLETNHKTNHTKFITTRFGNVLGSNGSVIPLFKKQIQNGGPITVTHPEITRFFMTIPEACQLVLEAAVMGQGGEIYIFDMGEPVKILDLAKKMIRLSGKKVDIDIAIRFSGLREGEKLYEELLNDFETVKITHHPKIKIAQVSPSSYHRVDSQIELFTELISKGSETDLVRHLKRIVPEFISNSSRFEVLDRMN